MQFQLQWQSLARQSDWAAWIDDDGDGGPIALDSAPPRRARATSTWRHRADGDTTDPAR
jgi:hypothetical protein